MERIKYFLYIQFVPKVKEHGILLKTVSSLSDKSFLGCSCTEALPQCHSSSSATVLS